MKKEVMKLWVEALESGNYPQSADRLESTQGMCCFGVLCDLAAQFSVPVDSDNDLNILGRSLQEQIFVKEWAGMKTVAGDIRDDFNLTGQNDTGATFPEIAKIIRKHWREL